MADNGNIDFIEIIRDIRGKQLTKDLASADPTCIYGHIVSIYDSLINGATDFDTISTYIEDVVSINLIKSEIESIYADKSKLDSIYDDKAKLDSLYADKDLFHYLFGSKATIESIYADKAKLDSIFDDKIKIDSIYADIDALDSLYADKSKLDMIFSNMYKITSLHNDKNILDSLYADKIKLDEIYSIRNKINSLFNDKATIDSIFADKVKLDSIYADKSKLDSIYSDKYKINNVYENRDKISNVSFNMTELAAIHDNILPVLEQILETDNLALEAIDAKNNAVEAFNNLQEVYLGSHTLPPTKDNLGLDLINGALYFDSVHETMNIYDRGIWKQVFSSDTDSMIKSQNLLGLHDIEEARLNIDVYSRLETDNKDTFARDRANHTGTQSLETITETANLKVMTSIERNKLANAPDDINLALSEIMSLLASDDATLDELQEVVNFIKVNRETLNAITLDNIVEGVTNKYYTLNEKNKLLVIENGATADQTATEIESLYESVVNTNKYTDNEKLLVNNVGTILDFEGALV